MPKPLSLNWAILLAFVYTFDIESREILVKIRSDDN